jgi:hypothetical protein
VEPGAISEVSVDVWLLLPGAPLDPPPEPEADPDPENDPEDDEPERDDELPPRPLDECAEPDGAFVGDDGAVEQVEPPAGDVAWPA